MAADGHDSPRYLNFWRRAAVAILWLAGPIFMGFLAATISGEHGSIVFVIVGLYVGIPGAISYLLLPLLLPFRKLGGLGRFVTYTVSAILPTVACAAYAALTNSRSTGSFFLFMSGIAIGFAGTCALLVMQIESRWLAGQ